MGKLFVVGIGPGGDDQMTPRARAALDAADALCGYTVYLDLVRDLYPGKPTFTTPMTRELERCRWAVGEARAGRSVALLCSGDAGVYGMAGPVLQILADPALGGDPAADDVDVEVVPGITAALAGAAVLGAPLMNDFCVVSLSDLLTPWDAIERRLAAAAEGDFSLVLYNPASRKRAGHLARACDVLLAYGKAPETVCGWVRNIGRAGQESRVCDLRTLRGEALDMFTTVFVGSGATKELSGRMVTPRGYEAKR